MIGRIALPRTTTVSLNDRFSTLRELREKQQQEVRMQQSASEASRHLVDHMEERPAVRAALAGPQRAAPVAAAPPPQKRLHVKQRLAIQARLGVLRTAPAGGSLLNRLGRGRAQVKRLQTARSPAAVTQKRGSTTYRGGQGRGRGRGAASQTSSRGRGGASAGARGRGGRGAGSAGRGRGATRGNPAAKVSKEDLDKQLDDYMSSTKGHLDAELDAYMKEGDA